MKSNAKTPAELRHKKPEKEVEPRKAKERGKTLLERGLNQAFGSPTPKQWEFLEATTRYVGYGGARGGGKAVSITTPIPTISGWKNMGDIVAGDVVFDENGNLCTVEWVSGIMYDHKVYELTFSDGSVIVADAEHEWVTETSKDRKSAVRLSDEFRAKRRAKRPSRGTGAKPYLAKANAERVHDYLTPTAPTIKTTQEIVDTLTVQNGREKNHAIKVCGAINLPNKELAADPYVLGAWLGDGTSSGGAITGIDHEIFNEVSRAGYTVTDYANIKTKGVLGLAAQLKEIGVFNNKHIPQEYLRASIEQRIALLQGLMDTDGSCDSRGQCEFYNTNKRLVEGVHELICSLGIKATIRTGRATLYGKDCGEKYRIKFQAEIPVFRLPRKLERQKRDDFRGTHERRYIVAAKEIESVPVQCIGVDSPSHLYLAGKNFIPTHNSHAVRTKGTMLCYRYPGIKILIIRESFPMLRRNYINPMRAAYAVLPDEDAPRWSDTDKAFIFPNSSTIELGYCATDADIAGYVGNEWDVLFLDEATQLSEDQFYGLNSCVRGVNKWPKRTYCTCNPGGQGHEWVKRLFIDRDFRKGERPSDYTFIQARVYDNIPLLMADKGFTDEWTRYRQRTGKRVLNEEAILACIDSSTYVQALKQGAPEMVKAWLEGDWNVFSGKFFGEFDPRVHVISDMTEDQIPSYWRRTAAIDYGLDCFAVLWFAESPTGDVICYRNYEQSNLIVERAAAVFLEMSKYDRLEYVSAPPDLWNRRNDTGRSAADIFADYGVHFTMAGNNREQGWLSVKEYLAYDHLNPKSTPRLRFLESCKHVIKYIQLAQFDVKKPNDVDANLNHDWTHSIDSLRYWAGAWRTTPNAKPEPVNYNWIFKKPEQSGNGYDVPNDYLFGGY